MNTHTYLYGSAPAAAERSTHHLAETLAGVEERIGDERLEHSPWATQCPDCARRVHQ